MFLHFKAFFLQISVLKQDDDDDGVYLWSRGLLVVLNGVYTHHSLLAVERGEAGVRHFWFKELFLFYSLSEFIRRFRKSFFAV